MLRDMNGLANLDAASLSGRMTAFNDDTYLDLGEDNSILFVGIDPGSLGTVLKTIYHL